MAKTTDLNQVQEEARAFPAHFKTLNLGTVAADGTPEASYAPYVKLNGCYYVYLSDLAKHCANLKANGMCSVLFIESEADSANVFARKRLTLKCQAQGCERGSEKFEQVLDLFEERFGNFIQVIRKLNDFHLFELRSQAGSYVAGFAKAYTLSGDDMGDIQHRNEVGHQAQDRNTQDRMDALS